VLEKDAGNPIPNLDASDAGTNLNNFSCAIRAGDQGQAHSACSAVLHGHEVAIIERDGSDPDAHLAGLQRRIRPFGKLQGIDPKRIFDLTGFHARPPFKCNLLYTTSGGAS
jgi:hypothetical protein